VIPLSVTKPAPWKKDAIADWYLELLSDLPVDVLTKLTQQFAQKRSHEFWLVFSAPTPQEPHGLVFIFPKSTQAKVGKRCPSSIHILPNGYLNPLRY
jgi:hypothetical protein